MVTLSAHQNVLRVKEILSATAIERVPGNAKRQYLAQFDIEEKGDEQHKAKQ